VRPLIWAAPMSTGVLGSIGAILARSPQLYILKAPLDPDATEAHR
jgi:hypothetical protein